MINISINDRIDAAYSIWMNAKATYFYSEYMYNPNTKEEKVFLSTSRHFNKISHFIFRVLILELSKLVNHPGSNDKFTLPKMFQELKKIEMDDSENDTIKELEKIFTEHKNVIINILKLRNKLYAHYDKQEINYQELGITFPKLNNLINDLGDILQTVAEIKLDKHLVFDPYFTPEDKKNWDDFLILCKARENRRNNLFNQS